METNSPVARFWCSFSLGASFVTSSELSRAPADPDKEGNLRRQVRVAGLDLPVADTGSLVWSRVNLQGLIGTILPTEPLSLAQ